MRTAICPTPLHFRKLANHFVGLTSADRFLRFGWIATDVDLFSYVQGLTGSCAGVCAVVEPDGDVSGVLHLEIPEAETSVAGLGFGLSVSSWARNQGIGTFLLQRGGLLAWARGRNTLFVHNLKFNTALQRLALRLGMNVACTPGALASRSQKAAAVSREGGYGFCGRVALVDDSLRSQWDGTVFDGAPCEAWPMPSVIDLALQCGQGAIH